MTNPLQRLVCKDCQAHIDIMIADDKEKWPQHRCQATRRAAPFTKAVPVPKLKPLPLPPDDEPRLKPGTRTIKATTTDDPFPYLKVIG